MFQKLFLSTLLGLLVSPVWSQFDDSNDLKDLMYFPTAGNAVIRSDFEYNTYSYDIKNASGVRTYEEEQTFMDAYVGFEYTFISNFSFGGRAGFLISQDEDFTNITSNTAGETSSSGLRDPEIFGRVRVIEQRTQSFNVDILALISPNVENREIATTTQDGNGTRGGFLFGLESAVGQKYESFGWRASVGLDYYGTQKIETAGTDVVTQEYDSRFDIDLGAQLQFPFSDMMAVNGRIGYLIVGSQDRTTNTTTGTRKTIDSYADLTLGGDVIFELIEDTMTLKVGIDYVTGGDVTSSGSTGSQTEVERNEFSVLGGIQFQI